MKSDTVTVSKIDRMQKREDIIGYERTCEGIVPRVWIDADQKKLALIFE